MARIYTEESDDELPQLADLLQVKSGAKGRQRSPQKQEQPSEPIAQSATAKDQSVIKQRKQRSLRKFDASQSLFGPFVGNQIVGPSRPGTSRAELRTSRRKGRTQEIQIFQDVKSNDEGAQEECASCDDEGSYHFSSDAGSDEESWLAPRKQLESPFKRLLKAQTKSTVHSEEPTEVKHPVKAIDGENSCLGPQNALPRPPPSRTVTSSSRPTSSSSALDNAAILHYTPPKRISPSKKQITSRSITPTEELPPSPSKKLNSPNKSRFAAIPRGAIRESIDAFWSQHVINDFNEQYSPRKMVASPRKNRFATPTSDDDNDPPSPSTSPRKSCSPKKNHSPKKSKQAREMKKAWDERKKQVARDFFDELDRMIAKGELAKMTQTTGGVELIWSKKLNTTAGRANWRREKIRDVQPDGSSVTWFKHTASIELAEKVIDDEVKLINVVAHEFCHLCNFMINGIRDNPHGKEFKEWAKKVSRVFGDRGIEVTTKHSYDIDYKYAWECVECSTEFKRHSKSIDPTKQACGACKGRLVQTRPAVRGNVNGPTGYQLFVREHCPRLKKENPSMSHGNVMELLGKLYREQKQKSPGNEVIEPAISRVDKSVADVDAVMKRLEVIVLDE